MKNIRSFTALDFETLTAERSSACAIGLVKVIDGYITQKFYSLIKPIQDTRTSDNSTVHGITRDMVANAPTFQQLWPSIQDFIGSDIIVCHNVTFDKSVWDEQIQYYSCQSDLHCYRFFCTYQMTGLSLKDACAKHNIEIGCHHDALDDAVACAKVMLAENGVMQVRTFSGGASAARKLGEAKNMTTQHSVHLKTLKSRTRKLRSFMHAQSLQEYSLRTLIAMNSASCCNL